MSGTRVRLPVVVLVTGTDTDVGKTLTTAALAAALQAQGASVAVYKPVQTGVAAGEGGDMGEVRRLAGTRDCAEGVRLTLPMAPVAAALRESRTLPALAVHVAAVQSLAAGHDHVLVEGAGGLLVALDHDGNTIADMAFCPARLGRRGGVPQRTRHTQSHPADPRGARRSGFACGRPGDWILAT
ncbi:dethiobiotin synthase [Arthrobacter psychrolactophilus]